MSKPTSVPFSWNMFLNNSGKRFHFLIFLPAKCANRYIYNLRYIWIDAGNMSGVRNGISLENLHIWAEIAAIFEADIFKAFFMTEAFKTGSEVMNFNLVRDFEWIRSFQTACREKNSLLSQVNQPAGSNFSFFLDKYSTASPVVSFMLILWKDFNTISQHVTIQITTNFDERIWYCSQRTTTVFTQICLNRRLAINELLSGSFFWDYLF